MRRAIAVFLTFVIAFNGLATGVMAGQMGLTDSVASHARAQTQGPAHARAQAQRQAQPISAPDAQQPSAPRPINPPCHESMSSDGQSQADAQARAQADCKVCCAWHMVSIVSPTVAAPVHAAPATPPEHRQVANTGADPRATIKPPCSLT